VTGNEATDEVGGGINNEGRLTLIDVSLSGNEAYDGAGMNNEGAAQVTHSTVSGNTARVQGGAMSNRGAMTIISSTLQLNSAGYIGGGIMSGSRLTVANSTLSGNMVETSEVQPWYGGGGFFFFADARVHLTNSTLSGNSAVAGGGILAFVNEAITMTNVTVFANEAQSQAGGIHVTAISTTVNIANSIIAGNSGGDCSGAAILSSGHNIAGDSSCNLAGSGDLNETDPHLSKLGDHGGPTFTHLPLPGSPAIDVGDDSLCPATDQRGYARPDDGDDDGVAVCDIGSVEKSPWIAVFLPVLAKGD
jgi:hypothetical protein